MDTLTDLLWRRARETPAGVVAVYLREDGSEEIVRFADLAVLADEVAADLSALQLPHRARVLLPMLPGRASLGAFWGTLAAGLIAVPVPPPVPGPHADRYRAIAQDCLPAIALTTPALADLAEATADVPVLTTGAIPAQASLAQASLAQASLAQASLAQASLAQASLAQASLAQQHPQWPTDPDAPAYLQYTSGTTGDPRGAVITHGQMVASCTMATSVFSLSADDTAIQWLPQWHDLGLLAQVLLPVWRPFRLVVMPPTAFVADPAGWLSEMSRRGATAAAMSVGAYELLTRRAGGTPAAGLQLDTWKLALAGADTADPESLLGFSRVFATAGFPANSLRLAYGGAEANIISATRPGHGLSVVRADYHELARNGVLRRGRENGTAVVGCGPPVDGMTLRIVDLDDEQPCPPGTVGEIAVGGPGVARDYWNGPARSVVVDGVRLLLTGDAGALVDGEVFPLGRTSDLVPDRSGRLHPAYLLERAARGAHPGVHPRNLAAFAAGDAVVLMAETRGSQADDRRIAAAIANSVAWACGVDLDDVALVPRGTIATTTSGKVRRGHARQAYLSGAQEALAG